MYFPKTLSRQGYLTFVFLLFSTVILLPAAQAQTTYTLISGDWADPINWEGTNQPPSTLPAGDEIIVTGNATLNVNNVVISNGAKLTILASGSLTTNIVAGSPSFTNNGTFNNSGTFTANTNMTNGGRINNNAAAGFTVSNEATAEFTNNGAITNNGIFNIGPGTFDNNSEFINANMLTNSGIFTNTGSFTNNSGGSATIVDSFSNNGDLINNSTFVIADGGAISQSDEAATLKGSSTFVFNDTDNGEFNIEGGTITPGNSFGTMTIAGNLTLSSGVTLFLEVIGGGVMPGNDNIFVTGTLDLGNCKLEVVRIDGDFDISENWDIITATSISGIFGSFSLPVVPVSPPYPTTVSGSFTLNPTNPIPMGTTQISVEYSGNTFLPIQLASFSGQVVDQRIQLDWVTETETNNHYFLVERSGDGLSYEEIGRVSGQGTTVEAQAYRFVDAEPLGGVNYYRLRQVDLDGQDELSKVITVNMDDNNTGLRLKAFPNPAQENIALQWFSSQTSEEGLIRLIDAGRGRELARYAIPNGSSQMEVPVSQLPAGHYFFQMEQQGERQTVRFVKK